MLIRHPRGWELPESAATSESLFRGRRALLRGIAGGSALLAALPGLDLWDTGVGQARADSSPGDPTADLYPARRNTRYEGARRLTDERYVTSLGKFYEFGVTRNIAGPAQVLKIHPWTVVIDGLVERPMAIDADDLIHRMALEERVYRHRCVEGWAVTLPWTGFPLAKLVEMVRPLSSARYIRFTSFGNEAIPLTTALPAGYLWPYVEGLTLAEAMNELTFIATGLYGKSMAKQNGAPLRLVAPWKYAFKAIKSIARIDFVDTRPRTFWQAINPNAYGFWANVNPSVPHPRWSQETELLYGTNERVPTQIFNGYRQYVADLYDGIVGENLYI